MCRTRDNAPVALSLARPSAAAPGVAGASQEKRAVARKMPREMVALGASAIAAVYAAGYVATRDADSLLATTVDRAPRPPVTPGADAGSSVAAPPSLTAASPPAGAQAGRSAYLDGTYRGVGVSRRGAIEVRLEVRNGIITGVGITRSNTPYPVERISALPEQVVSRQTANVDQISGATYSTRAFQAALEDALAQALLGKVAASAPRAPLPSAESISRVPRSLRPDPEELQHVELALGDEAPQPSTLQAWAGFIRLTITNRGSQARSLFLAEGGREIAIGNVAPEAAIALQLAMPGGDYLLKVYGSGVEAVAAIPVSVR